MRGAPAAGCCPAASSSTSYCFAPLRSLPRPRLAGRRVAATQGGEPVAAAPRREVACSDLANLVESVNAAQATAAAAASAASTAAPAAPAAASTAAAAGKPEYGASYYSGLVTSPVSQDNGAGASDMLRRSLQLAGGAAALLGGLLVAFMASNGLL